MAVGKNITKKKGKGSNMICSLRLWLLGRGGGDVKFLGKKIKIYRNGGGEKYQIEGNFIHPCYL